ncbi:OmpW/AlkL family protein [Halomonas organivorans]|uniref:Outer membrane protein n=1 Tax=Halomonas organivorans TaxID=257772 RepID=A0A7W5C1V4_9GAMM|nr:OmpW family outer membrane protein [Halomonas organivorans]MBB3142243.1 outer membrane protein [Halomonas organivorans]
MNMTRLLTATVFTAAGLVATQSALAYQAGDFYVRGGIAKSEVKDDNGRVAGGDLDVSDERGFTYGLGYQFHDKLGVELNGSQDVEHDLALNGADIGSIDRRPVNLMLNYYPLGGTGSRVQPYAGAGLNYTSFNDETLSGLDVDDSYGAAAQVGVDMALTDHLLIGAFANYANVDADVKLNGNDVGNAEIDPVTVGGGLTYRF